MSSIDLRKLVLGVRRAGDVKAAEACVLRMLKEADMICPSEVEYSQTRLREWWGDDDYDLVFASSEDDTPEVAIANAMNFIIETLQRDHGPKYVTIPEVRALIRRAFVDYKKDCLPGGLHYENENYDYEDEKERAEDRARLLICADWAQKVVDRLDTYPFPKVKHSPTGVVLSGSLSVEPKPPK